MLRSGARKSCETEYAKASSSLLAAWSSSARRSSSLVRSATRCSSRVACCCSSCFCSSIRPSIWLKRSEEHTSELQSPYDLVCRLLLEKKKKKNTIERIHTVLSVAGVAYCHATCSTYRMPV